jgi:5-deoxy-glucuronate isomerase
MNKLLIKPHAPDPESTVLEVTPKSAGWTYVGFKMSRLAAGEKIKGKVDDRETCLVVITGSAKVVTGDISATVGGRKSVFDDAAPGAVYVPAGVRYSVEAVDDCEVATCSAPGHTGAQPRLIEAGDMSREVRGSGSNTRYVRNILPDDKVADSLLVVEVVTPGGNWSSYPPHKHDTATAEQETSLEETYYHRLSPPQGFAFQRVYTDDRSIDETMTVQDGDVVMVPRGYHPVGAPHGYDLYYLNVMAGPERRWMFRNDPEHAWIVAPK